MLRDFLRYVTSVFGALAALPAFFPFGSELLNILKLPLYGNTELIGLANSISCVFVLLFAYAYASRYRVTLRLAAFFFALAGACWVGYLQVTAPSEAVISLGFSVAVAENFGFNKAIIIILYLGIFTSFTAVSTLLLTIIYRRLS